MAKILITVIVVLSGAFYWYYTDSQSRIATLQSNNAKLETAVQTNEQAIASLKENNAKANAELTRINSEFQKAREQNRELSNKLAKHDLGLLGSEKPALVERIINGASNKAGRCFELLSGSPLTEEERNAPDGKSFNSECPWLYDSLVGR